MMANFGIFCLKNVLMDDKLEMEIPMGEEKQHADESSGPFTSLTKVVPDPYKLELSDRTRNLIILHISDNVLRKV